MKNNKANIKHKEIYKIIVDATYSKNIFNVFSDFIELMALEMAIGIGVESETRIEQVNKTKSKYNDNELEKYSIFKSLIIKEYLNNRFQDVLGVLFHDLNLQNEYKGQFFTPYTLSYVTAKVNISNEILVNNDFIEALEPACGSGGMAIAASQIAEEYGYNYSQKIIWTMNDVDIQCVYMSYIQCNLTGIAAVIQHADTLSMKVYDRFYTAAYILNNCCSRIASKRLENRILSAIKNIQKN
uniref:N-6 DNA methylase n=1 Tax=Brachyspira catarrhinii TaxID=2528966 RepID=UPI003F4B1185